MKLNLGCGPHVMNGWINYDSGYPEDKRIINCNLILGNLPHADKSTDFIFSEHFIEHAPKDKMIYLFRECYRVLKQGGVMRVSTPNLSYLISNYSSRRLWQIPGVWEPKTLCDMVNEGMRLWGHEYIWDTAELHGALKGAGFEMVLPMKYRISEYAELRNLEVRPFHYDLIFEATRLD